MAKLKLLLSILISFAIGEKYEQITDVDSLKEEFLVMESKLWNNILDNSHLDPNSEISVNYAREELVKSFKLFDNQIQLRFPRNLEHGIEFLQNLWVWERIRVSELRNTFHFYDTFRYIYLQQDELVPVTMRHYSGSNNLGEFHYADGNKLGDRIQEAVIKDNLFENTLKEANSDLCNLHQSPQQLLYNLYQTLALTELKGYSMMQFSYMVSKLYNRGNITHQTKLIRETYKNRTEKLVKVATDVMKNASRNYWICDPKKHYADETFIEVTQLLQGYIENEIDMSKNASCMETCDSYSVAKNNGCYQNLYCAQQRPCKGKILNCKYYDADMLICPGTKESGRRYQYIEYENGHIFGQKDYCTRGTTKVESWWRWLFWRCSYCFCLCDEQGSTSDRYFNLRNVQADYEKNNVVTGLRFVKVNQVIHLQIQQGQLLPRARINERTVKWVPVDDYHITDDNVYAGDDYHTLTFESRALDLDELKAKPDQVITGVRFRRIGSHLNFEIQVCPFNFSTGELIDPKNYHVWVSNDNTDADVENPRRILRLRDPDVPTRTKSPSVPDSLTNQFLHFVNTDIVKDAAQTTVPFIDAQMVVPQVYVPLSGAGIYHKGQPGYGGFLAPKVATFDYTPYMFKPEKTVE